ncbi:DUF739 family protein [Anaeromicropila populeti]|uniref:Cro/C1-type HTH DNA-binding domain-containing protein n=1 Tax=Anaeromicropila populeti TaxID=37658 RepID=A0A1I6JHU9_9FIRM|nr:DUF739 family protein [Anaeromicropila populeti]SFR78512.1 Protein of unknown function [Anaeromicropila populeti]
MVNTRKIRARIVELGLTYEMISGEMKIAKPTISQKINNVRPMRLDEAQKLVQILQIDKKEYAEYFFV